MMPYDRDRGNRNVSVGELLRNLEKPDWKEISKDGGLADRFSKKLELNVTQLRKFFDQVKNIQEKLESGKKWEDVEGDVWTLVPTLKYAKARRLCQQDFVKFVEEGIKKVSESRDPERTFGNFTKIFEAVVAYYKYNHPGS